MTLDTSTTSLTPAAPLSLPVLIERVITQGLIAQPFARPTDGALVAAILNLEQRDPRDYPALLDKLRASCAESPDAFAEALLQATQRLSEVDGQVAGVQKQLEGALALLKAKRKLGEAIESAIGQQAILACEGAGLADYVTATGVIHIKSAGGKRALTINEGLTEEKAIAAWTPEQKKLYAKVIPETLVPDKDAIYKALEADPASVPGYALEARKTTVKLEPLAPAESAEEVAHAE